MSDLLARLVSLADCDGRAGEPLGKAMREAAAEIVRLDKHIAILHDIADQRDTLILERDVRIARMKKDAADGDFDYLALQDRVDKMAVALEAEKAARRKLTALLDEKMGTPCEQIRRAQEIDHSERMGDRDTLSWLLAPFFCANRQPHMSGDMRNRLSPMRRRDLDEAVQAIIASGFAQIGTEMDHITIEAGTSAENISESPADESPDSSNAI